MTELLNLDTVCVFLHCKNWFSELKYSGFPYLENKKCVRQCENISLDEQSLADLKRYIGEDYRIEWILDDLPAGSFLDPDDRTKLEPGFQIGYSSDVGTFLYNHVEITILYTRTSSDAQNDESVLITGFRVSPRSVNWGDRTPCGTENIPNEALEIKSGMPAVAYTYSVEWREAPDSVCLGFNFFNLYADLYF